MNVSQTWQHRGKVRAKIAFVAHSWAEHCKIICDYRDGAQMRNSKYILSSVHNGLHKVIPANLMPLQESFQWRKVMSIRKGGNQRTFPTLFASLGGKPASRILSCSLSILCTHLHRLTYKCGNFENMWEKLFSHALPSARRTLSKPKNFPESRKFSERSLQSVFRVAKN